MVAFALFIPWKSNCGEGKWLSQGWRCPLQQPGFDEAPADAAENDKHKRSNRFIEGRVRLQIHAERHEKGLCVRDVHDDENQHERAQVFRGGPDRVGELPRQERKGTFCGIREPGLKKRCQLACERRLESWRNRRSLNQVMTQVTAMRLETW
jgi:hypothetical protein